MYYFDLNYSELGIFKKITHIIKDKGNHTYMI